MSKTLLAENMSAVSRCSNQWSTEHAYNSDLLARRLGHHRRRHVACGAINRDRRNRVLVLLHAGATMTCATISYFTAILGALVGFFVANLFRVGGRS
jgi:hypothetical protein